MSNLITRVTQNGTDVQVFDLGDTISIRVETPRRLSYLDVPREAAPTIVEALLRMEEDESARQNPAPRATVWVSPKREEV